MAFRHLSRNDFEVRFSEDGHKSYVLRHGFNWYPVQQADFPNVQHQDIVEVRLEGGRYMLENIVERGILRLGTLIPCCADPDDRRYVIPLSKFRQDRIYIEGTFKRNSGYRYGQQYQTKSRTAFSRADCERFVFDIKVAGWDENHGCPMGLMVGGYDCGPDLDRFFDRDREAADNWNRRIFAFANKDLPEALQQRELRRMLFSTDLWQRERFCTARFVLQEDGLINIFSNENDDPACRVCTTLTFDQFGLKNNPLADNSNQLHLRPQILIEFQMDKIQRVYPIVDLSKSYQVCLSSTISHARLEPAVQTLLVDSGKDNAAFCIEHNSDPVKCWAQNLSSMCVGEAIKFRGAVAFVEYVLPSLVAESVTAAFSNRVHDYIFKNTEVAFFRRIGSDRVYNGPSSINKKKSITADPQKPKVSRNDDELMALFKIPKQMCHSLQITPQKSGLSEQDEQVFSEKIRKLMVLDFFCLRIVQQNYLPWVGHFAAVVVTKPSELDASTFYFVLCKCTFSSSTFPSEYLTIVGDQQRDRDIMHPIKCKQHNWIKCDVEMIRMDEPFKRMRRAMQDLVLSFAYLPPAFKELILGGLSSSRNLYRNPVDFDFNQVLPFMRLNAGQLGAVQNAVPNVVAGLIGPPGTGKTAVILALAVIYSRQNKQLPDWICRLPPDQIPVYFSPFKILPRRIIAICCSSNTSADNIILTAEKHKITDEVKFVRICSRTYEKDCYPTGPICSFVVKKTRPVEQNVMKYHLHQIIRNIEHPLLTGMSELVKGLKAFDEKVNRTIQSHRQQASENEEIVETNEENFTMRNAVEHLEEIICSKVDVIVTTCSSGCSKRLKHLLGRTDPSVVVKQLIVDDASTTTMAECLIPLLGIFNRTYDARVFNDLYESRLLLVGDPKQIGPTVQSRDAKQRYFYRTFFDRMVTEPADPNKEHNRKLVPAKNNFYKLLTEHYRMPEAVAEWPSRQFYDNLLVAVEDRQFVDAIPADMFPTTAPCCFVSTSGIEEATLQSTNFANDRSFRNEREARIAVSIAHRLHGKNLLLKKGIVILSVYNAQIELLKQLLKEYNLSNAVSVGTISSSQGYEWDYVILSCVRSRDDETETDEAASRRINGKVGLISQPKCMNVGLTRSLTGLFVIGNPVVIAEAKIWFEYLDYSKQKHFIVNENFFNFRI